jgi:hypothetical protein
MQNKKLPVVGRQLFAILLTRPGDIFPQLPVHSFIIAAATAHLAELVL